MVKLDIMSDPICPWCYIGKTYLDQALAQMPDHPFTIEWHPFQLNPDMPADGMDRQAYLEAKFGGRDAAVEAYRPVVEHQRQAGLDLRLGDIARTPNTINAHRLIHWAGIEGRQPAAVSALFKAYFTDVRDIGDTEVLADLADGIGLDASVIARLLASDADIAEIRTRDAAARQMGIASVPTFIIAGQHAVPGAQPADLWLKVLSELRQSAE